MELIMNIVGTLLVLITFYDVLISDTPRPLLGWLYFFLFDDFDNDYGRGIGFWFVVLVQFLCGLACFAVGFGLITL